MFCRHGIGGNTKGRGSTGILLEDKIPTKLTFSLQLGQIYAY